MKWILLLGLLSEPWVPGESSPLYIFLSPPYLWCYTSHRVVLDTVPLKLDEERRSHDFPRSWILPVLKDHVANTELGYFKEVMLPLATRLGSKGKSDVMVLSYWSCDLVVL